jgi:hypothetical protein
VNAPMRPIQSHCDPSGWLLRLNFVCSLAITRQSCLLHPHCLIADRCLVVACESVISCCCRCQSLFGRCLLSLELYETGVCRCCAKQAANASQNIRGWTAKRSVISGVTAQNRPIVTQSGQTGSLPGSQKLLTKNRLGKSFIRGLLRGPERQR